MNVRAAAGRAVLDRRSCRRGPRRSPCRSRGRRRSTVLSGAALERLEDRGPLLGRDAGPSSATDTSTQSSPASRARDADVGPGRRVAGRVLEQVGDHLVEQRVVGVDERQVVGDVERPRGASREQPVQPAHAVGHQLVEGDGLALGLERAGLDAAQAQQVGDEPVEPLGLVARRGRAARRGSRRRSRRRRGGRTRRPGSWPAACAGRATPSAAARLRWSSTCSSTARRGRLLERVARARPARARTAR